MFNEFPSTLPSKVRVFDSTLTLGEQVPGVSFTAQAKVEIAESLDALGVDVIEAGFPATSEGEKRAVEEVVKAVRRISRAGFSSEISCMARARKDDVEIALQTETDYISIFAPVSDINIEKRLRKTREEVKESVVQSIELAKSGGAKVEFVAEDASRADVDFLWEVLKAAEEAGADYINLTDSLGLLTPTGAKKMVIEAKRVISKPLGVTFHNDFGMATANTIAAVEAGAENVHVSVNGLGPKAGIAPLEQVVMALHEILKVGTNVQTHMLSEVSELVERLSGITMYEIMPIVGPLVYTYEAGVHVHGLMADPSTYEPVPPDKVGKKRRIVVGKLSGKSTVQQVLKEMGIEAKDEEIEAILLRIKALADQGVRITESVFMRAVEEVLGAKLEKPFEVQEWTVVTGSGITPLAHVRAKVNGKEVRSASVGVGPVDALANALRGIEGVPDFKLRRFRLRAISSGTEALGEVLVRVLGPKGEVEASGISEDILEASLNAFEDAVNKIMKKK